MPVFGQKGSPKIRIPRCEDHIVCRSLDRLLHQRHIDRFTRLYYFNTDMCRLQHYQEAIIMLELSQVGATMPRMLPQNVCQIAYLTACWWFDGVCFQNIIWSNKRDFVGFYLLEQDFSCNCSGVYSETGCYIEDFGGASRMHSAESVRRSVFVVDWLIRPKQIMV